MQVKLVYGRESIQKEVAPGSNLAAIANNTLLSVLGAPTDNVRFTRDGDVISTTDTIYDGDVIYVEQAPHKKA
jgi:hypothetical protein